MFKVELIIDGRHVATVGPIDAATASMFVLDAMAAGTATVVIPLD